MTRYEAMEITFTVPMPQRARLVFLTIASFSNKENSCFPSIKSIVQRSGVSESSVHRAIADLIALGLMTKVARTRTNNGCTSNLYELTPVSDNSRQPRELDDNCADACELIPAPCQADRGEGVNLTPKVDLVTNLNNLSNTILTDGHADVSDEEKTESNSEATDITLDEVLGNCELEYIPFEFRNMLRDAVTRLYYADYLHIGKNIRLPGRVIRDSLRYLNYHTLEAAYRKLEDTMKKPKHEIRNSAQYVTVLLYNSISEVDSDLYLKL